MQKLNKNVNIIEPSGPSSIPAWALEDFVNKTNVQILVSSQSFKTSICTNIQKGDIEEPNNYRPTSNASVPSKISETVLKDKIMECLNENVLIKLLSVRCSLGFFISRCAAICKNEIPQF